MKLASVERITEITSHPNAERLEFAHVLGYKCLVPVGVYKAGELAILIQPDSVLPDEPWAEVYRKFSKSRVKAVKLRGEWSMGIVESLAVLSLLNTPELTEGLEVSQYFGITKYEPPQPQSLDAIGSLPFGIPKTDEERYQNLDLETLWGKSVKVTQKIDGSSFTFYYKDGTMGVCSRTQEIALHSINNWTAMVSKYDLENRRYEGVILDGSNVVTVVGTIGPEPDTYTLEWSNEKDKLEALAKAKLSERLPDWQSELAYWDAE